MWESTRRASDFFPALDRGEDAFQHQLSYRAYPKRKQSIPRKLTADEIKAYEKKEATHLFKLQMKIEKEDKKIRNEIYKTEKECNKKINRMIDSIHRLHSKYRNEKEKMDEKRPYRKRSPGGPYYFDNSPLPFQPVSPYR